MAELVGVYDAVAVPRTASDVIARPGADGYQQRARGPEAAGKWLTASIAEDAATVIAAGSR
jgi:hypothetical protein